MMQRATPVVLARWLNGAPVTLDELLERVDVGDRVDVLTATPDGVRRAAVRMEQCTCGEPGCEGVQSRVIAGVSPCTGA